MTGFEVRWLDLRESADHLARDGALRNRTIEYLNATGTEGTIVDLGCGTGSTFRAFSPEAARWHWRLVDNDPLLLAEATSRHGSSGRLECLESNLSNLSADLFAGARLVTASALCDLVSEAFLSRLVDTLASDRIGFYAALNYDGHCVWDAPLDTDAHVVAAFNAHQRRDKGFGPALGPSAMQVLRDLLLAKGFHIVTAESPWRLGATQAELQRQLIEGMAGAVIETGLMEDAVIEDWRLSRIGLIDKARCEVGHWDMLALPK